jgi:hypothetical protein
MAQMKKPSSSEGIRVCEDDLIQLVNVVMVTGLSFGKVKKD